MNSLHVKEGETELVEVEWDSDLVCPGAAHVLPLYPCGSDPCLVGQSEVGQSPQRVWYVPEAKGGCSEMRQTPTELSTTSSLSLFGWSEQSKKMPIV